MPHLCSIDQGLHGRGYKKTHPRHRIIELFYTPRLWSARELEHELHDVSMATIYRTLRLLEEEKHITSVPTDGRDVFFERTAQPHHDHQSCERCHVVECLPCPVPTIKTHTLNLRGLCNACTV